MARTCKDVDCIIEVFGRCRGEYCGHERRGLIERASRRANSLGHALSPFQKVEGCAIWRARCERCDLEAAITLTAEPGEPDVYGKALNNKCPSTEDMPAGNDVEPG